MPLGKSGKHYLNPSVMRAHGDSPEAQAEQQGQDVQENEDQSEMESQAHTVNKHEDGSYSSKSEDGESGEHRDFHDAIHHMSEKFGEDCPGCGGESEDSAGAEMASEGKSALGSLYEG